MAVVICLAFLSAAVMPRPVAGGAAGGGAGGTTQLGDGTATATVLSWDPVADFHRSPAQANPSPDAYGHPDVWTYLASSSFDHDPAGYDLLPHYSLVDAGRQQWDSPEFINLLVAHVEGERSLLLHSFGGNGSAARSATLGWRSPVAGEVTVRGWVELSDPNCSAVTGGVIFWVDQGSHTLQRFVVPAAHRQAIDMTATVTPGEQLYFIVDPGLDSNCDSTLLQLSIEGTGPTMPDTAMRNGPP